MTFIIGALNFDKSVVSESAAVSGSIVMNAGFNVAMLGTYGGRCV